MADAKAGSAPAAAAAAPGAALIAANTVPRPEVVIAQTVFRSAVLDVPLSVAWDGIRAFASSWVPDSPIALAPEHAEDGTRNVIGRNRIVTVVPLKKRLVEELVVYDALKYSYTYRLLAAEPGIFPAPSWNYFGTVRLYPITEGDKALATWTVKYETAPGPTAAALSAAIGDGILAANLKGLNQYLTAKHANAKPNTK